MGESSSSSRGREIAEEASKATTYFTYDQNPCYFLEVAVRAFLKCLGLNSGPSNYSPSSTSQEEESRNQTSTQLDDPAPTTTTTTTTTTETEMKTTEDVLQTNMRRRAVNIKKPQPPPVGTGPPGQINSANSS